MQIDAPYATMSYEKLFSGPVCIMGCWNLIGNYDKLVSEPGAFRGMFENDVQDSFKQCVLKCPHLYGRDVFEKHISLNADFILEANAGNMQRI